MFPVTPSDRTTFVAQNELAQPIHSGDFIAVLGFTRVAG
jgi:hypothetical protein